MSYERIDNAEFVVAARPDIAFSIAPHSTTEDFIQAVAICALVATGKVPQASPEEVKFCEDHGEKLIAEAETREPGAAQRIVVSIALAAQFTNAAVEHYGSSKAAMAAIKAKGPEAVLEEVAAAQHGIATQDPTPFGLLDDDIL